MGALTSDLLNCPFTPGHKKADGDSHQCLLCFASQLARCAVSLAGHTLEISDAKPWQRHRDCLGLGCDCCRICCRFFAHHSRQRAAHNLAEPSKHSIKLKVYGAYCQLTFHPNILVYSDWRDKRLRRKRLCCSKFVNRPCTSTSGSKEGCFGISHFLSTYSCRFPTQTAKWGQTARR